MSDTIHCPHGRLLAVTCEQCEIERLEKQLAEAQRERDRVVTTHRALMQAVETRAEEAESQLDVAQKDAVDGWEAAVDWAGYASEYFQQKHGLEADRARLEKARAALKETKE